jgi:hypothetical protein
MWQEITKDVYMDKVKGLKPIESFSDPDGILPYGYGCPAMDTVWGNGEKQIVKCEMRKQSRHDVEWQFNYFEAV